MRSCASAAVVTPKNPLNTKKRQTKDSSDLKIKTPPCAHNSLKVLLLAAAPESHTFTINITERAL